ncbi:unnamed protein product, partial [Tetraodon nigroviridis]
SALFYFRVRGVLSLTPQVSFACRCPCRETGSEGAVRCRTPAAAKDRPNLRALITPRRRS